MTDYAMMVLVDADENASLGVLPIAVYDDWNSGKLVTEHESHCSLFFSDHVTRLDDYQECVTHIFSKGGRIVEIIGGLVY